MKENYGKVIYDDKGKVVCHICGKSFDSLGGHVWNFHGMRVKEYRKKFGLDMKQSLVSEKTRLLKRSQVSKDIIKKNLVEKGKGTRFEKGHKRTKNKYCSEQTRRRISQQVKEFNQRK